MNDGTPRFVSCPCQHCSGHIEFELGEFEKGETRTVECPHCRMDTLIFVPQPPAPEPAKEIPKNATKPEPSRTFWPMFQEKHEPRKSKKNAAIVLDISSAVLFVIGLGMSLSGCIGEMNESTLPQGSAIRQSVYALQYGCGFIVISLSLILSALVVLIRKD